MARLESEVAGGRVTVEESAEHSGRMTDTLGDLGRNAADWCRRNGVPTGWADGDGRRVMTCPDAALRDSFGVPPETPPDRESPFC